MVLSLTKMHSALSRLLCFSSLISEVIGAPADAQGLLASARKRCTAHDDCWPSSSEWSRFNSTISGRLITSRPPAASCHRPNFDSGACENVKSNWTNGTWRTDQIGSYSAIIWELGDEQCFPWTDPDESCQQGLVAAMTVDAREVGDIQAAVRFAATHDLLLTVKNTGHDHLGRPSGDGSFAIWTHNLRGREWHSVFFPQNAPSNFGGVSAVTLQAGEEWLDVYRDADVHNVTIAGGSAISVGAVGGYVLGGGHSPFSHFYGLAADNLLEATIVTPCGEHIVLNEYTDPEYFWALRGGRGNAWGILTSATYKTHPLPTHIQVAFLQAKMSSESTYRKVYTEAYTYLRCFLLGGPVMALGVDDHRLCAITARAAHLHRSSSGPKVQLQSNRRLMIRAVIIVSSLDTRTGFEHLLEHSSSIATQPCNDGSERSIIGVCQLK